MGSCVIRAGLAAAVALVAGCSTGARSSGTATGDVTSAARHAAVAAGTAANGIGGYPGTGSQAAAPSLPGPVGGIGGGGGYHTGTGGGGTGSASSSAGAPPPALPHPAPPPPPAPPPTCNGFTFLVDVGYGPPPGGGSAGHNGYVLSFQSLSHAPCTLTGYPGVSGASVAGTALYDLPRSPRGMYGGLPAGTNIAPLIVLGEKTIVSAVVEWSDVPSGAATSCPSYPHTLVTLPNTYYTVNLPAPLHGCDLTVHPVVPGTAGGGPDH